MNVQIQAVKFDADRKLIEFVEAKMAKIDRFIERATCLLYTSTSPRDGLLSRIPSSA